MHWHPPATKTIIIYCRNKESEYSRIQAMALFLPGQVIKTLLNFKTSGYELHLGIVGWYRGLVFTLPRTESLNLSRIEI